MISKVFKTVVFFVSAIALVSCDKDYNEIGTDIIGGDHYNFEKVDDLYLNAATYQTGPVQSNGQTTVPFGIYNDPHFGTTTANFVTQIEMATVNPTLDNFVGIDSVRLYVPYTATIKKTKSTGDHIYTLGKIYGDTLTKFDFKIYENKYFLRSQDVVDNQPQDQAYYNDMSATFDSYNTGSPQLNNFYDPRSTPENIAFKFSSLEIKQYKYATDVGTGDTTTTRQSPGLYVKLDTLFFKSKVLQAPAGMLANNNVFKNYFRGLHFKLSSPTTARGVLNMVDFTKGAVTIYYRRNIDVVKNGVTTTVLRRFELKLNLTGNSVSLLDYQNPPVIPPARLVVKGGQGTITAIDMLTTAERDAMRNPNWLINEANLIFNVDEEAQGSAVKPKRLYLYDMTHSQPIVDYNADLTTNTNTELNKSTFSGILDSAKVNNSSTYKYFYKVRVTNYIRSLIMKRDSTIVRLGLSVTNDITEKNMVFTKNPISVQNADGSTTTYKKVPKSSVINPFGVVLHGPDSEATDERLKLIIYYTKPDEGQSN